MSDTKILEELEGNLQASKAAVEQQRRLLQESTDMLNGLKLFARGFSDTSAQWGKDSEKLLPEVRQLRMALGTEWAHILNGFADVRKFFLSADHAAEVARLRAFVELCERLKALKDNGFLDRVADTMLQLEERAHGRK